MLKNAIPIFASASTKFYPSNTGHYLTTAELKYVTNKLYPEDKQEEGMAQDQEQMEQDAQAQGEEQDTNGEEIVGENDEGASEQGGEIQALDQHGAEGAQDSQGVYMGSPAPDFDGDDGD